MLGSVKSNIGHLEVASGIAGLIKAILCVKNRAIPATLHFTSPNPELQLVRARSTWLPSTANGRPTEIRRAGVSSFGVGGTNAHVVIEEAPPVAAREVAEGPQVLLLSARTAEGLRDLRLRIGRAAFRSRRDRDCPMWRSRSPAAEPTSCGRRSLHTTATRPRSC